MARVPRLARRQPLREHPIGVPIAVAGAVVAAVLSLAACSEPGGSDVEVAAETVAWAGDVCTEVADVRTAIGGIGDGLSINPLGGAEGLAEARAQVDSRVADVQRSIDELRARIDAAPDDAPAQEAKASLDTALTSVETATDRASTGAQEALDAGSIPDAISAAGGALGAVRDAVGAVGDLIGTATGTASGASAEVRAAFDRAPECQDLN